MSALLAIRDLALEVQTGVGPRPVVEDLSLGIAPGEALALVGESGSGKSVTALAIMGLLPEPAIAVSAGEIRFAGRDLLGLPAAERRRLAGAEIAMIFQEPMTSLNPVMRVGDQIVEMIRAHERVGRGAAMARAGTLLERVRIPDPMRRLRAYPHQLSGGQRQRVMIAMALACRPRLLIADEPTTALDVTVQARILELLRELGREFDMAMLFITHDLGVVANVADRVAIMYGGRLAEVAPVRDIFRSAAHPYAKGLLACIPSASGGETELAAIPGQMPTPLDPPNACRFAPRCGFAKPECRSVIPPETALSSAHRAWCHHVAAGGAP